MTKVFSTPEINSMSYTDFVGLVNQWNVPPGAYNTLTSWVQFGGITASSNILEVACTTGFSNREIALMTGAESFGIDLSEASIQAAIKNRLEYAPDAKVDYMAVDAMEYFPDEKYSHVILGAALRFFPDPHAAVGHVVKNLLMPGGVLLSTEFYCDKPLPQELVEEARAVFGITVTQEGYKKVMAVYSDLTLLHEERHTIYVETQEELDHYCDSTISRFAKANQEYPQEALDAMRKRLMTIKDMSNRLRPYQKYNVLVHKADPRYYPDRYTELF